MEEQVIATIRYNYSESSRVVSAWETNQDIDITMAKSPEDSRSMVSVLQSVSIVGRALFNVDRMRASEIF